MDGGSILAYIPPPHRTAPHRTAATGAFPNYTFRNATENSHPPATPARSIV